MRGTNPGRWLCQPCGIIFDSQVSLYKPPSMCEDPHTNVRRLALTCPILMCEEHHFYIFLSSRDEDCFFSVLMNELILRLASSSQFFKELKSDSVRPIVSTWDPF